MSEYTDIKNNTYKISHQIRLTDEEREEVVQLENDMYDSNLLFRHKSLEDNLKILPL